ncbi:MAG: hypothetical protein CM15mP106_4560 [Candidatus Neomarinimicrobiota bacterium]|nr:MAG: hypothetical protein CM15mP106_4560 [Candidatus Neomarinimicrobiota bacterium]
MVIGLMLKFYPKFRSDTGRTCRKLEQLRWLKAGWTIGCTKVDFQRGRN